MSPVEPHSPDSSLPLGCQGLIPLERLLEQSQESSSSAPTLPLTGCS